MKRSIDRILTTHTGSLPRPDDITDMLYRKASGNVMDLAAYDQRISDGVCSVVDAQARAGIDIVNDGETGKLSYFSYVTERLTGFGGKSKPSGYALKDMSDFPGFTSFVARNSESSESRTIDRPVCLDRIAFTGQDYVAKDIESLLQAAEDQPITELFLSSASPGLICAFLQNAYYKTREEYLFALADAMRTEYELIANAGIVLQLDCPDLAASYNSTKYNDGVDQFRNDIALNIDALNHATRNIPEDQLRMHVCWGNYDGPHNHDVPLKDVVDIILTARPSAVSFEGANPRHAHEHMVWDEVRLPDGKILMPGVIDSTSNYVEHPDLVAQRILSYATRVGRENIIPGSDCGFSTGAGMGMVHTSIVWAKLTSLAEGARIATRTLW